MSRLNSQILRLRFAHHLIRALALACAIAGSAQAPWARADDAEQAKFFEERVRPLLVQRCYECHSTEAKELRGGLMLDSRSGWQKGGDQGPAVVPGKPQASLLVKAIEYRDEELQMPPKGKLADAEIEVFKKWVESGAFDPREAVPPPKKREINIEEGKQQWAFQPLRRVEPPAVQNTSWPRNSIDRFILARLEERQLVPTAEADRRALARRVSLDLTGLPPSVEEIEAFLADQSPDAYDKLLDRLLASPHYGERWGRHWLDLARFAESHGFEHDYDRPFAFHYRDFVIQALNRDLPFDTFVRWQLAGDEIAPEEPLALMATGFLANGVHATQITANQVEKERYDELDDMLSTTGTAMLGLTLGCARCHDHKFDPIPTADYYRLLSTFTTTVRSEQEVNLDPADLKRAQEAFAAEHAPLVESLRTYESGELAKGFEGWLSGQSKRPFSAVELGKIPPPVQAALAVVGGQAAEKLAPDQRQTLLEWFRGVDPQWQKLNAAVDEHQKKSPRPPKVLISSEGVPAVRLHTQGGDFLEQTHLLRRGDPNQKVEVVKQGFLQVLSDSKSGPARWEETPPPGSRLSYRRKALANWITDVDQGAGRLLARVIVNRLWQHHFGRGIVATSSDFGKQGAAPSHPELLDWLATELIANGWRLKPIHKAILQSAAYRQGSAFDPAKRASDPDNALVWRFAPRRLEAETVRDAILAVTGQLDRTPFGPGTLDERMRRRSIYFTVKRSKLIPMLQLFDAPDANQGIGLRAATTVAPQALLLMNSPIVRDWALELARRLHSSAPSPAPPPGADSQSNRIDADSAIRAAYRAILARDPDDAELRASAEFLHRQTESYRADGHANPHQPALADVCQALFSLNEFVFLE